MICGFAMMSMAQPQPVIDDFAPRVGTPGDKIQVTGSGFSIGPIKVYFSNGVLAPVAITSDTILTATVPAAAATGPLGIQRGTGDITATGADFTRIGPGPYISGFLPSFGASNTLVVISGVHLAGVPRNGVRFNGVAATDAGVNAAGTEINAHVPYGAPVGVGPISVTSSAGTSNSFTPFTVIGPGPYVTGFSPNHGSAETTVLIDGVHFTGATAARFNGIAGPSFSVQSDTRIRVNAPANVATGPLTVVSALGNVITTSNFFAPPAITNLSISSGRTGTNILIKGINLRGAQSLTFNGTAANFTVFSNYALQTTVPAGARTGQIRVTTPYYSAFSSGNFVVRPTIHGFSPGFGVPRMSVTITGANFNAGAPVVRFNGVQAAPPTGVSFGQLTAIVPDSATTGPISITTDDGSHTNANNFFLPASISSFTPTNSAPGTRIRISGVNFLGATAVSFNGVPAPAFTVTNNTTMGATVPAGVSTGPITITTPAGAVTSAGLFYGAPVLNSFSPIAGGPGTNVTVQGTNFLGATAVRFNGLSAQFSTLNNGQIVAVVPNSAQTGPITVEAPAGTNTSISSFAVEHPSNLEIWITDTPDPVTATSNLTYAVTMINRGPFEAPHVRLTNTLPSSARLVSATMDMFSSWTILTNGNSVVATTDNVAAGATSTLTVKVAPQTPGIIVAAAVVASDHPDPQPENNSAAITSNVEPLPSLSIDWWTNRVKVSWHVALSNFVLESRLDSPASLPWSPVTNIPAISGSQKWITESNTTPTRYYRLKK